MDKITAVVQAVADAFDGISLDDSAGNLIRAHAAPPDSLTPPALTVDVDGIRWADTGRTDGTASLDLTLTLYLPGATAPVVGALANRFLSEVKGVLQDAGKTLGGTALAWRLRAATVATGQLGGRPAPTISTNLEIWLAI